MSSLDGYGKLKICVSAGIEVSSTLVHIHLLAYHFFFRKVNSTQTKSIQVYYRKQNSAN